MITVNVFALVYPVGFYLAKVFSYDIHKIINSQMFINKKFPVDLYTNKHGPAVTLSTPVFGQVRNPTLKLEVT